jgi:CRP-like cAMP-binding protein
MNPYHLSSWHANCLNGKFVLMDTDLAEFLLSFSLLNTEDREAIGKNLVVHSFKKGAVLLQEGEISAECFFILKGCVRQYYLVDGDEKTTAFFTERQAVTSYLSYVNQVASKHYFVCNEDTKMIVGNLAQENEMYKMFPKLVEITRMMMEQDLGKTQEDFAAFITSSPEKRYLDLADNRPDLLNRVPQHQIASYIGVTPESLSRIRKRLLAKK